LLQSEEESRARYFRDDESRMIAQMVREFSTFEPFGSTLRKQLNLIGIYLHVWLDANAAGHVFTNPIIPVVHWMHIGKHEHDLPTGFAEIPIQVQQATDLAEPKSGPLFDMCRRIFGSEDQNFLLIPFSQPASPFGMYVFSFSGSIPSQFFLRKLEGSVKVLSDTLGDLLYNHYPITPHTYLPSFLADGTKDCAILFCDLRNSTRMTEVARMAEEKYGELLVVLLKSFLEYASRIISIPGVGRIHKFMGDGFLATFGEYLTLSPETKATVACALAVLVGKLLAEGFERLWTVAHSHQLIQNYLRSYNEDLELRLGVGINYGSVHFDHFGIFLEKPRKDNRTRGFTEYTSVGDHMNFASRLCSVANQPISALSIAFRSKDLPLSRLTAPIVASRTVMASLQGCVFTGPGNPLAMLRTDFEHKGKGHPSPGFELWCNMIDSGRLLHELKGLHDDKFHTGLIAEVMPEPSKRPELGTVIHSFLTQMDSLTSKNT